MIEISKAFVSTSMKVFDFFQSPGLAFYVPLYQRAYSWDKENIDQLVQDIMFGVEQMLENSNEIRFLGTVIVVSENNPRVRIHPIDDRSLPTKIEYIIDGQQRVSTIALLATLLYARLHDLRDKLPTDNQLFDELRTEIGSKLEVLLELFSVDLKRGEPKQKPIVIRGGIDRWTLSGPDDENYHSDVALYLAKFIRAVYEKRRFPTFRTTNLVESNLQRMSTWLRGVENAHLHAMDDEGMEYPAASAILEKVDEIDLWTYPRPEIRAYLLEENSILYRAQNTVSSIVQLLAFTHYLVERCCFTVIDPAQEDWAFDMFQSLNATGTPLTSIETFKPVVVSGYSEQSDDEYANSQAAKNLERVDRLLGHEKSAAKKSKLTDEYITLLAYAVDGTKLPRQFSQQRKWLEHTYIKRCSSRESKELLIRYMGDIAEYYGEVSYFDAEEKAVLSGFPNGLPMEDKLLATTCTLYLHDAMHKMAHTILGQYYSGMQQDQSLSAGHEYVATSKALAAFFTLWRAALTNAGLDNEYRRILRSNSADQSLLAELPRKGDGLSPDALKLSLRSVLNDKGIGTRDSWLRRARSYFRFDHAATVCRFGLFVVAEDTVPDSERPGLPKIGKKGSSRYLDPKNWEGKENKTLEHVAPQSPPQDHKWDSSLYDSGDYHLIGNLTLLPANVNTSAGNRDWRTKHLIYSYLGEMDEEKLEGLAKSANHLGVSLPEATVELLKNTTYKNHMVPLMQMAEAEWNQELVQVRTERICEIVWDRMWNWLS